MAKLIYSGLEDSGKTYKLAETSVAIAFRNGKWIKQGLPPRAIVSNVPYTKRFRDLTDRLGVPLRHWTDLEELPELRHCDLFIDEVGTYFDSRNFKDLPLDIRLWLAQASKLGVDIYGGAQDFAQVDLAFRRLTTTLHHITKFIGSKRPDITRPPVGKIWGICSMKEMDPVGYDEAKKAFNNKGILPSIFFLRKEYCDVFDTTQRVAKSKPPPYKHVVRACADPNCKFEMFEMVDGKKHKISHV